MWTVKQGAGYAGGYTTGGRTGQASAVICDPDMRGYHPAILLHEAKEALYMSNGKRAHKDGATGVGF